MTTDCTNRCCVVAFLLLLMVGWLLGEEAHKEHCQYKFHVWKPEENVLEKIKTLENHFNYTKSVYDSTLMGLKLQLKRQQEILKNFSKMGAGARYRSKELVPANYEEGEVNSLLVMMSSIKSSVSDLKGEWVLLKRQFNGIHSENTHLKNTLKSTSELANNTQNMLQSLRQDACYTNKIPTEKVLIDEISKEVDKRHLVPVRYNINTMTNDFEKLEKEIREIKQDQYTIKNQLYLLAMLTNHSVERPLAHIIDRILPPNQSKKTTNTIKPYYSDCEEARLDGNQMDGVYKIKLPNKKILRVYCNMEEDSGWIVVQRRIDGTINFNKNWSEYEYGFGNQYGEFWIGNEYLHQITSHGKQFKLHIQLRDFSNNEWAAVFNVFSIASAKEKYRLTVLEYQGNSGDSLSFNDQMFFSTKDQDNDNDMKNCAEVMKGGWWYNACSYSNLNGVFKESNVTADDGIHWYTIHNDLSSLKYSLMKIMPHD